MLNALIALRSHYRHTAASATLTRERCRADSCVCSAASEMARPMLPEASAGAALPCRPSGPTLQLHGAVDMSGLLRFYVVRRPHTAAHADQKPWPAAKLAKIWTDVSMHLARYRKVQGNVQNNISQAQSEHNIGGTLTLAGCRGWSRAPAHRRIAARSHSNATPLPALRAEPGSPAAGLHNGSRSHRSNPFQTVSLCSSQQNAATSGKLSHCQTTGLLASAGIYL